MKPTTLAYAVLTVLWILYAALGAWVLLAESAPVQRQLLLVIGGFMIIALVATAAILAHDRDSSHPD